MNAQAKISPAFEPFLADSGPADEREAIVVFRGPETAEPRVRGRLRALKQRLDFIKQRSEAQRPLQEKLFEGNRKLSKASSQRLVLTASEIGKSELPVAALQVTAKTLPELAERSDTNSRSE